MHAERSKSTRERRARATVGVETAPDPNTWDDLWDLYLTAFEPLQELALLNHLYSRAAFDLLLADERVSKLIAWYEGRPVGLAMITNQLDIVPQISPPFLHRKYPEMAERQAVFFGIMIFVAASHRRTSAFARLIAGMGQITAQSNGVVVFDICRHNLEASELDRQIATISRWFPGSSFEQVDEQKYFAATLPTQPERRLPISSLAGLEPTANVRTVHQDHQVAVPAVGA
jgi:hypothetical protein